MKVPVVTFAALLFVGFMLGFFTAIEMHAIDPPLMPCTVAP